MKVVRAKVVNYVDVTVERTAGMVTLTVGDASVPLTRNNALRLADCLVDTAEGET